ncbi:hypothetical protein [Aliikangiella sp. G2MR2-5]|uniref:hypothetical protein n=1 Tax=Aliikangiella sp. G2MR2-5 TaxID=2788943 RepID=UPI0018A971BE|nr:hypothetical protein [Aliikangiella sp. G2MR2-5]
MHPGLPEQQLPCQHKQLSNYFCRIVSFFILFFLLASQSLLASEQLEKKVVGKVNNDAEQKLEQGSSTALNPEPLKQTLERKALDTDTSMKIKMLVEANKRYFEYLEASRLTHLQWPDNNLPVSVALLPIVNYSGIPIEKREASVDYFDYGKIPAEIHQLFADNLIASRFFSLDKTDPDYYIQLIIDEYRTVYPYSPDDKWWQKKRDEVDRAFTEAKPANIKLSVKLVSANKHIKPWVDSVKVRLSHCDLNSVPQPLTQMSNQNLALRNYLTTTTGQSFLAASNFLISKAIERVKAQPAFAKVVSKYGNEITILSEQHRFSPGDKLKLHYLNHDGQQIAKSFGEIMVIKSEGNESLTYPVSLRGDHIKVGDLVSFRSTSQHHSLPEPFFESTGECAPVSVAQVSD